MVPGEGQELAPASVMLASFTTAAASLAETALMGRRPRFSWASAAAPSLGIGRQHPPSVAFTHPLGGLGYR